MSDAEIRRWIGYVSTLFSSTTPSSILIHLDLHFLHLVLTHQANISDKNMYSVKLCRSSFIRIHSFLFTHSSAHPSLSATHSVSAYQTNISKCGGVENR